MKLLEDLPQKLLTDEQEQTCANKINSPKSRKQTKINAQHKLVLHSMRFAFCYAQKVSRRKLPPQELFSLCYAALERASRNFKAGRQRFVPYAKAYIRGAICKEWRSKDVVRNAGSHVSDRSAEVMDQPPPDEVVEPEYEQIRMRELWALLAPHIPRLTEVERTVLDQRYTKGMNFQEIADALKITRSAAQGIHVRSLRKLRCHLLREKTLYNV